MWETFWDWVYRFQLLQKRLHQSKYEKCALEMSLFWKKRHKNKYRFASFVDTKNEDMELSFAEHVSPQSMH